MRVTDTADQWWKSAVLYCLDLETFLDRNDDGIGDLAGLAHRIDYLAELGITCLWLMPFYPTPDRDDGYDITDFYGVDPRLGDHGRIVEVIRMAHHRGIRVIADLVINHTSDQVVFPDKEDSIWELDDKTGSGTSIRSSRGDWRFRATGGSGR